MCQFVKNFEEGGPRIYNLVAAPGIFPKVFLKKHKLHNLIKKEYCILVYTIFQPLSIYISFRSKLTGLSKKIW